VDVTTIRVTVEIEVVTETRTYSAGIRLDGREPSLLYETPVTQAMLTLFGPVADLDRLGSAPIVVGVNVSGLGAGTHVIPIVPSLPSTVTLVEVAPASAAVTITEPASPSPSQPSPAP
jgi:hypothetical protein